MPTSLGFLSAGEEVEEKPAPPMMPVDDDDEDGVARLPVEDEGELRVVAPHSGGRERVAG